MDKYAEPYSGQTVLITGGSGSFGSALCQYLKQYACHKVIVYSRDWLKQKKLREALGDPDNYRFFIGDIRDKTRLVRAMDGVDIVIHAAAIKDLPACENDPAEAMQTNIVGTQNVIDACIEANAERCLFISSDKAVAPCNAYGISKAMGESLWLNGNKYTGRRRTIFNVVRYGNVCGSSGSVIPLFDQMVRDGATSLPVTDPAMTRFHFTMEQVMEFVSETLKSGFFERGKIYTPELPSIHITDICKAYGLPYRITGIRAGEKIHETMGNHRPDGTLIDSGNNERFLSVEELKESMRNVGCKV